ncbi:Peptidase C19 [Aphelenchoides avenae]|nr:Peptidase C19 [Aphelenchus avenae]
MFYGGVLTNGLANAGFLCYVNSCVQALGATDRIRVSVKQLLATTAERCAQGADLPQGIRKQAKLVYGLSEVLDGLALGRSPTTVEVWRRLRDVSRGFEEGQQCDVQEFYMQVMSAVEELITFASPLGVQMFPTKLKTTTVTKCIACKETSPVSVEGNHIEIVLPEDESMSPVEQWRRREKLPEGEEYACQNQKCAAKTEALRWTFVSTLPQVLVVHFNRFKEFVGADGVPGRKKVLKPTSVPMAISSTELCEGTTAGEPITYFRLEAVVLHLGEDIVRGHYVTVRRIDDGPQWLVCDDATLFRAKFDEMMKVPGACPYLLFYNRM